MKLSLGDCYSLPFFLFGRKRGGLSANVGSGGKMRFDGEMAFPCVNGGQAGDGISVRQLRLRRQRDFPRRNEVAGQTVFDRLKLR